MAVSWKVSERGAYRVTARRLQLAYGRNTPAFRAASAAALFSSCCGHGDWGGLSLFSEHALEEGT